MSESTFGSLLRAERERKNMTAAELAEAAGITRQQVHNLETGRRSPLFSTACKIAYVLGIEVTALIPSEQPAESISEA